MKTEKLNLKSIPLDKVVEVKFSGSFYQRLNKLLMDHCDSKSQDELLRSLYLIKNDEIPNDDPYTFNLDTLMILLSSVEKAFENAGHTVESTIDVEVPENFKIDKVTKK